ncbi:putative oxidoreductase [Gordonia effusa NBRC 100432]|uniref:Putative oxidoreductase n=1 Tax=Gordonia effusa NBRC 100432 TaxID=1077974 RepID=H0QXY7_9ACTN|nr:FAD-dependent oxidoreductase [Gordonia effusa]GAB17688.1 putative oxidoreductase [Gordonia effusa NBRC 100432]
MSSLWRDRVSIDDFPSLDDDGSFDYAIVGAGLTGMATAVLLARRGASVAVIEGRTVGACTTGNTTGKVSLLQGSQLSTIARRHRATTVDDYVTANSQAQQWILDFCESMRVPFQWEAAYSYAQTAAGVSQARAEYDACRAAGLDVSWEQDLAELPFDTCGGVRLDDQIQLDAMELLRALVSEALAAGVKIFEHSRVRNVRIDGAGAVGGDKRVVVDAVKARVRATATVLATGTPVLDRGGFFARLSPHRSYGLAFRAPANTPRGMYVSVDQPTRSLRYAPDVGGEYLLVGGNGHIVGRAVSPQAKVDDLIDWSRAHFDIGAPAHQWSAQDYTPVHGLPYAGALLPGSDRILVASGYNKWGMTNAVAAAHALAARLLGDRGGWARVLETWTPRELAGLSSMIQTNAGVAVAMTRGWLTAETRGAGPPPAEGEGRVERRAGRPVGICTVNGATTEVSAVCPHLYGVLRWNDAESSWDCPLHGSRFAPDGAILEGPATAPLHNVSQ